MTTQAPGRRRGRPPKSAHATPTRQRLVDAAIDVFADVGFAQTSITDVAARADVSGPAVYKHFGGKAELLIEAARQSLHRVSASTDDRRTPRDTVRLWLSPGFERTRRLLVELHLAADRDDDLFALLAQWHLEQAERRLVAETSDLARIKAFYLLLMGLSHVESLRSLEAPSAAVLHHVDAMVDALFPTDARQEPT